MSKSTARSTASRRTFLQRVAIGGLAAGPGSALLAACATGGDDEPEAEPETDAPTDDPDDDAAADNPLGIDPEGDVEIFIFAGGLAQGAYATDVHIPILEERWPDLTVNHQADSDVTGALQSRFAAGDPPEFVNNSGDGRLDTGVLVNNGQLADLTPLFDAPSWDDPNVTVRDSLVPGTVEQGTFDAPYELNYAFTVFGLWYNRVLFDNNGWEPPQTWDDMLALCADMQSQGIAPWAYPGSIAPRYMHWPLLTMATKLAGSEILVDIDNLVEGAWQHEAILESANALRGLRDAGYFLEGTEGMSHIQSQVQWALGNVGFVTCGTWLESEVASSFESEDEEFIEEHELDPDAEPQAEFEFAMCPDPLLSSDSVMPYESLFARAGEPFFIPADSAHPEAGMEYMRAMLSQEGASGFTDMTNSLTSVLGAADDVEFEAPGLTSAAQRLSDAGTNVVNYRWDGWYPSMNNPDIDSLTGELLAGRIDAQEWAEGAEGVAQGIRDDDQITKYTR
jgi:N-acetylglucosamine transport system substrate-binding protein